MGLPVNAAARAHLSHIDQAARRAADLCQQMLAYAGQGQVAIEPVNLTTMVRDCAALLQQPMPAKATLHFELAPDLPAIHADLSQMRQVVLNLVTNAAETLDEANGSITVTTGAQTLSPQRPAGSAFAELPAGEYVFLEVRDTGSGMDAATRARIFEPFFTTKFTGRGLGLSAVLGIVRGHNGGLHVDTAPGRGSTFRLVFPRAP
jgi:two-component system, cell cycle sensor histidine kinase and response regulator CckA